jgi:hypothetical protein
MLTSLAPHVHKLKFLINENSTTLLTGVGVVGTVATAVLAGRSSFKASDIINAEESNLKASYLEKIGYTSTQHLLSDDEIVELETTSTLSKTEKAQLVWKEYLPPVAVGITTVTCIIMANRVSSKKIAAIAVASTISERTYQEYKDKVVEKLGPKQETAISDEIAQDKINNNPASNQVIIAGSGDVLCFEPLTGRYFNSTIETVKKAENKVNFEIIHYDSASLSTFFEEIGLAPTDYSDMVGWNVANRMEVSFSTTMSEDNRPCLVVGFTTMPSMNYDKVWT